MLLAALASCGGGDEGPPADTGISGTVVIGTGGANAAISVDLAVYEPSASDPTTAGELVTSQTTDEDGSFEIDLEPGTYLVTSTTGMFCDTIGVTVEEGEYAEIQVPCDTGFH